MNNIYVCHTIYHLMITLAKVNVLDNNILMLCCIEDEILISRLEESQLFDKIYSYNNNNNVNEQIDILKKIDNIFIFNDWTAIGIALYHEKIKYHLLEDGYNFYQMKNDNLRDKLLGKVAIWRKIYNKMIGYPFFWGNNDYCIDIEVNSLIDLPKDKRRFKFKEVSREKLLSRISENRKKIIQYIFQISETFIESNNTVLILTQPLYQDKLVNSLLEQYNFYNKLCEKYYEMGYHVYLKPHPRDNMSYSTLKNVNLIQQNIPIELIENFQNISFDIGITHSSSALDFLTCVKNKIIIFNKD